MAAEDATKVLDELLDTLDEQAKTRSGSGDAIDAVLNASPRTTKVKSLRDAPEVAAFRRALVDGLISVDTANQLLKLVNEVVLALLKLV